MSESLPVSRERYISYLHYKLCNAIEALGPLVELGFLPGENTTKMFNGLHDLAKVMKIMAETDCKTDGDMGLSGDLANAVNGYDQYAAEEEDEEKPEDTPFEFLKTIDEYNFYRLRYLYDKLQVRVGYYAVTHSWYDKFFQLIEKPTNNIKELKQNLLEAHDMSVAIPDAHNILDHMICILNDIKKPVAE